MIPPSLFAGVMILGVAGCSSNSEVVSAVANEPAVTIRETLARSSAMIDVGGQKMEVQKLYVQQRLIFAFTPKTSKPFEMADSNVLLVGRLDVYVNRLTPGVYRLDGDGTIHKIAEGAQAALIAWNDEDAWVAPKPAKFTAED